MRKLSVGQRIRVLNRCVLPVFDFHCTRWAVGPQIVQNVDTLQRRMINIVLQTQVLPGETPAEFVRRRGREASKSGHSARLRPCGGR